MKNLVGILLLVALLTGCEGTGDRTPGPPPEGEVKKTTQEILEQVPLEHRETVRQTLEENERRYSESYNNAMKKQGKK